jgi:hypothetical protein
MPLRSRPPHQFWTNRAATPLTSFGAGKTPGWTLMTIRGGGDPGPEYGHQTVR